MFFPPNTLKSHEPKNYFGPDHKFADSPEYNKQDFISFYLSLVNTGDWDAAISIQSPALRQKRPTPAAVAGRSKELK